MKSSTDTGVLSSVVKAVPVDLTVLRPANIKKPALALARQTRAIVSATFIKPL